MDAAGRSNFRDLMIKLGIRHLDLLKTLVECYSNDMIKRLLIAERKCVVRVYVLKAINLASRDNGSDSDPYIEVTLGQKSYSDRDEYQEDEPNPEIYKKFDFEAIFPGTPMLSIKMWDYDLIFGDDLIGETLIDLEDRYFSSDWNSITNKPIEQRSIYHPSTKVAQGAVLMWCEILSTTAKLGTFKNYDITPVPVDEYEVRIVVWDTKDIPMMDVEGTTDGFFKAFFDPNESKETDTHFRNQDGKCSFNYRLLLPVKFQKTHDRFNKNTVLTIQGFDRDLFSSNDLFGQATLDLKELLTDSQLAKRPISLSKKYYDEHLLKNKIVEGLEFDEDKQSFWVKLTRKPTAEEIADKKYKEGELVKCGQVRLQIDIYPRKAADNQPVGEARDEPNKEPFLPLPTNRISFSLNPFTMLNQMIGPALRRKIYTALCCFACCALCIMVLPMIASDLMSKALLSIFGLS